MTPYLVLGSTPVFVFEKHSEAISPWALARRSLPVAPSLVTFDRHTDTLEPFLRWAYWEARRLGSPANTGQMMESRLLHLDYRSDEDVLKASVDLRHDEHIRASMGSDIITEAFVIAYKSPSKSQRVDRIHYLPETCYHGCTKRPHDDECDRKHSDLAIDDSHIGPLLQDCQEFGHFLARGDAYILDIDLDYFRTIKSMAPLSCNIFLGLASRAACITVAMERNCVIEGRLDPDVDSEWALDQLLGILRQSTRGVTG
jgi:hypothetical protein